MEYLTNPFMAYAEIPPFTDPNYTDYGEAKTTYWADFRVCGGDISAIKDTYNRALPLAKDDLTYGIELSMVLNWLSFGYAETHSEVAKVYSDLWIEWDTWLLDHLKGDELDQYIHARD